MIKLVKIAVVGERELALSFSDGSTGDWDASDLIERDTVLTRPLADPAYFARGFIESGALAWPNGLELAPWTLRRELELAGLLRSQAA